MVINISYDISQNKPLSLILPCNKSLLVQAPGGLIFGGAIKHGGVFALRVWGAYIWRRLYMEGLIFGILRVPKIDNTPDRQNPGSKGPLSKIPRMK